MAGAECPKSGLRSGIDEEQTTNLVKAAVGMIADKALLETYELQRRRLKIKYGNSQAPGRFSCLVYIFQRSSETSPEASICSITFQ